MKEKLKEIHLGIEAIEYMKELLTSGNTLARNILQKQDLNKGDVITLLPERVSLSNAVKFHESKLSALSRHESLNQNLHEKSDQWRMEPVQVIDSWIIAQIQDHLKIDKNQFCIFEDVQAKSSDPWLLSPRARSLSLLKYQEEVYYLLQWNDRNNREKIKDTLKYADAGWYFLCAMSSLPEEENLQVNSPPEESIDYFLRVLAERVIKIAIGAYDGEGFLLWTKDGFSNGNPREQIRCGSL